MAIRPQCHFVAVGTWDGNVNLWLLRHGMGTSPTMVYTLVSTGAAGLLPADPADNGAARSSLFTLDGVLRERPRKCALPD